MRKLYFPGNALDNSPSHPDKTTVFSRIGHVLLIVALLGATGAHWGVMQSFAWAQMFANNSRTENFTEALSETFDGKHPCALCRQIAQGKRSDKKTDVQLETRKLEFFNQAGAFVVNAPTAFVLLAEPIANWQSIFHAPPVPPPRASFV